MSTSGFLGPPKTAGYVPSVTSFSLAWALSEGSRPPFRLADVEYQAKDPQVQLGLRAIAAPLAQVQWRVQCKDAKVAAYVDAQLKKIWASSLPKLLKCLEYGRAAGEVLYGREGGRVVFDRLADVHPLDAAPLVLDNQLVGIEVRHAGERGTVRLGPPRSLWLVNDPYFGTHYGRSRLESAWVPWMEKTGRLCAIELRRLHFMKNAMRGDVVYFPEGETDLGTPDVPNLVSNQDIAREVAEKMTSGATAVMPNTRDEKSNRQWEITGPTSTAVPEGLLEYVKDLDNEILKALGVPPEVLQASGESGSGYAGRAIPAMLFYVSEDQIARTLVHTLDKQVIKWLVRENFGRVRYTVEVQSLVPKPPPEGGGAQGQGAPAPGGSPLTGGGTPAGRVPYQGPRGGHGLRDPVTGRVRYQRMSRAGDDKLTRRVRRLAEQRYPEVAGVVRLSAGQWGHPTPPDRRLRGALALAMIDAAAEAADVGTPDAAQDELDHLAAMSHGHGLEELKEALGQRRVRMDLAVGNHGYAAGPVANAQPAPQPPPAAAAGGSGWERGQSRTGHTRWVRHDPATGRKEFRYQESEPGHRERRQRNAARALAIAEHVRGNPRNVTPEHLSELADHLPALTVPQLRHMRGQLGAAWGNEKRREELVAAVRVHVGQMLGDLKNAPPAAQPPVAAHGPDEGVIGRPAQPKPGRTYTVPTSSLHVDPERFQYKLGKDKKTGAGDELKEVQKFNPAFAGVLAVWRDPEDGKDYVVNGHHRHELAGRTGHPEMAVQYIDAPSAQEARSVGALINIAGGKGTVIDAAKFFRDTDATPETLARDGISLESKTAKDAVTLGALNDRLFNRLVTGRLDPDRAKAIAGKLPDHDLQDQLLAHVEKLEDRTGREVSPKVVAEYAEEMAATPTHTAKGGGSLFGEDEAGESLFHKRQELKSYLRTELAKEEGDFKAVSSERRAGRVGRTGNVLNTDENKKAAEEAGRAKNVFAGHVNLKGPVSDAVNQFAKEYADAGTAKDREAVRKRALDAVRSAVSETVAGPAAGAGRAGEGAGGGGPGGDAGQPTAVAPAPAAAPKPAAADDRSPLHGENSLPKGEPAPPSKIDRLPGLTPDERAIEAAAARRVEADFPGLRKQYLEPARGNAAYNPDGSLRSVTVNTDEWRDLFHGYNGTNAQAVHEPASYANKQLLTEMLREQKGKGNGKLAVYAGGGGSGKGTAIKDFFTEEDYPIRVDQVTDNVTKANALFDRAIAEGYEPQYVFVDRPPAAAWSGVVGRALALRAKGQAARTVPIDIALKANVEARRAAIEILKSRPDVSPSVIDNTTGEVGGRRLLVDRDEAVAFLTKRLADDEKAVGEKAGELKQEIVRRHAAGEIPTDIARGLYGTAAWDALQKGAEHGGGVHGPAAVAGDDAAGPDRAAAEDDRRAQPGRVGGVPGGGAPALGEPGGAAEGVAREEAAPLTGDGYVRQALANLKKTSRTAGGVVDTSGSAGKSGQMAEGLVGSEAAKIATRNFEKAVKNVYKDATDPHWKDGIGTVGVLQIADDLNRTVNQDIVKPGVLDREGDSPKFPYTKVEDLPRAKRQFAEELAKRLSDPDADPVETAAWVEWRANLTDHFWADGCGKTARALAALPLMRAGLPLPEYGDNRDYFRFSPGAPKDPKKGPQEYTGQDFQKFADYYRTLMPGAGGDAAAGGAAEGVRGEGAALAPDDFARRFNAAFDRHDRGAHNFAHLGDLKAEFPELTVPQYHEAIRGLQRRGLVTLPGAEGRHGATPEEQAVAMPDPGNPHGRILHVGRKEGAEWPAPKPAEPAPPETPGGPARSPHLALADAVAAKLRGGGQLDAKQLWEEANRAYGGTRAEGKYGPSDAYDALETGFNQSLAGKTDPRADLAAAQDEAREIADRVAQLPTQTNRSGNKDSHQQFSTPPHYAYAAAWLANLSDADTVLEPSAGTGSLAVQAKNAGATVYANELDPRRAEFLKGLFGHDKVHVENAEQISGILPKKGVPAPTAVVMNPPFSQTAGRMGDKKELLTGARHIAEAAEMLAPGGRLVAIVGRGMTPDSPTYRDWFRDMAGRGFTLKANVGVGGGEYKKYGTQFGTRVLTFDRVPPSEGSAPVTGDAEDVPDLMAKLEGVRNDRPRAAVGAPGEPDGAGVPEATEGGAGPADGAAPATAADVAGPAAGGGTGVAGLPGRPEDGGARVGAEAAGGPGGDAGGGLPGTGEGPGDAGGVAGAVGAPGRPAPGPDGREDHPRRGKAARGKPLQQPAAGRPQLREPVPVELEPVAASPTDAPDGKPADPGAGPKSQADLGDSLYESYRPQLLRVKGAKPHVTPLVESAAMAAVRPPQPSYRPVLSPDVVAEGRLSEAALENVVYAGQAHSKFLPAAEGDVSAGKTFLSPEGEPYDLISPPGVSASGNQTYHLMGGGDHHNFLSRDEAADFLTKNGWKNANGTPVEAPAAHRRGYFVGDGTGAGKGRQIAGVITDNWNQGRRKHVWVSKNANLLEDAHRDWKDLGNDPRHLIPFDKIRDAAAPPAEGVAFITYDTLKNSPKAREGGAPPPPNIETLANWLGKDFDGVIAFDEAHGMANALATDGARGLKTASQKALAGIKLQQMLPKARVLYVSATGATEVGNLAYAERLGVWGRGTPFATKQDFINEMEKGGVAAMEAVAQSLKATGGYAARSLAFTDGTEKGTVTYQRLTHKLSDDQKATYDSLADGWQKVLHHIDEALEATGGATSAAAKSAASSQFWGAQQRFFNQIITAMQTPSVIRSIEEDVAAGRAPVVQVVNTGEAATKRALAKLTEGEDLEDMDVSPRQVLQQYLEKSFPVHRYEEFEDENGNVQSRVVKDAHGDPVEDPRAVRLRDELVDMVGTLRIPESPLDMIVNHFGPEAVAEATGRTQRLVYQTQDDGSKKKVVERRNAAASNAADAQAFQDGRKKVLVFSDAGGTGRSYHADKNAKNQAQRVHYMLQPGWRADNAVQGLGRTHRTNQAVAPAYRLVEIDQIKAQKRFISTISRRLDQLGALTRGQRQAGSSGLFSAADNLESPEAKRALDTFFGRLRAGQVEGLSHNEVMTQLGFKKPDDDGKKKRKAADETPPMGQFLNRLLSLRVDTQAQVFDAFDAVLKDTVERAAREGTLDVGMENFPADSVTKKADDTVYRDPESGAEARHVTAAVKRKAEKMAWGATRQGKLPLMYVRNRRSGRVRAVYSSADKTDATTGRVSPQVVLRGPTSTKYADAYAVSGGPHDEGWERLDEGAARKLWEEEHDAAPEFAESEEHFLTGAFLPIWDKIPGDRPKVYRLRTDDGQTVVGRHVPVKLVPQLLKNLGHGHEAARHAPETVHAEVAAGRRKATLANGWKLKPARVQNEKRIELTGPSGWGQVQQLEQDGVIRERVGYDTRYFVPTGPDGVQVLARLLKDRPVTDLDPVD